MTEQAIQAFLNKTPDDVSTLLGGHINESYIVSAGDKYVLQRLNNTLYVPCLDAVSNNYTLYRKSCASFSSDGWVCPQWLTYSGGFFYRDEEGNIWRMYRYIPSDDFAFSDIYETGRGLGMVHNILDGCEGIIPIEANTRLYDLSYFYRRYKELDDREDMRDPGIDGMIKERIGCMLDISIPAGHIIHGDAKISNIVYNGRHVAGFIDLDTIMPGSIFNDLADCARSCCLDNSNKPDPAKISDLLKGYEAARGDAITGQAELLNKIVIRNMFMLGLRYYTDVLSGEGYFADLDDEQKLRKARMLLL